MGIGLVLEGGALRGLFTSGIVDVLLENNIKFDAAVGVSAGVVFGTNLKSCQKGRGIRYNLKYSKNWRYKSFRSLLFTGDLFGADFCYHKLPKELDLFDAKTFREDPMDFYAVVTDVENGKPFYKRLTDGEFKDLEWVRASASMPLASRIVKIDGGKYLDGGISDSIPLRFMEEKGFKKNIVVLTQPLGYEKKPYKIMPLVKTFYHKYPNLVKEVGNRHEMYNEQTAYVLSREKEGACFVIRPEEALNIKPTETDPNELQRVYDHGVMVGNKLLNDIRDFISLPQPF